MPPPNKPQNSPDPPLHLLQRLDKCLPAGSKSMRASEPLLSNASLRRIASSSRARPAATSIADIFVRSLVVAGYCHEHSPRGRGLTTLSAKPMKGNMGKWEDRGMAGASKRVSSRNRPDYLGTPGERLGVHRQRTQRMFNSSVAQRVETYDCDDRRIECPPEDASHQTRNQDVGSNYIRNFKGIQPKQHGSIGMDGKTDKSFISDGQKTFMTRTIGHNKVDSKKNPQREIERYRHYTNPDAELYPRTSKIYREALKNSLDWKEASDNVAAPQQLSPEIQNRRSALQIKSVRRFVDALWNKNKSNHFLFGLYRDIPYPGIIHLSHRSRTELLYRFAHPRDRRWVDARRFLALVEDMFAAGLPVSRWLWSTAIHLAGRAMGKTSKQDLLRAIGLWQQMEHLGGIKSDAVVFTILFDISIKAGQYTVAERLMQEMRKRNIQFARFGKVSQMYYYGLLRDPDSIRRTFDEFVGAGEIVDTAVLNCLMASFLRTGEVGTAEQMYQRMVESKFPTQQTRGPSDKATHLAGPGLTSELVEYRKRSKKLSRLLQSSASLKNSLPDHHRALQEALSIAPDTRTFHIFLSHHAYRSGDLGAFVSILDDMENIFIVPPRGMIYLLLFDGFAHYGRRGKGWTADKLWMAWKAYLRALYESKTRLNNRAFAQPEDFVWENPLRGDVPSTPRPLATGASSGLYTPLPSTTDVKDGSNGNKSQEHNRPHDDQTVIEAEHAMLGLDGSIDINEIFSQGARHHSDEEGGLETLERRIDNGVFLGRRMIIIILRAFGTCCGPEDVMEVWLRLESIWQPEKRKGLDVLAVHEELEKQMNRPPKSH
ncbi:hypothetical protein ARAM_004058 [Aspergillus rambellii]|uniref:Pentatricopeptide repeat protein n=1 Tax=Aspergillus rambellii TaxID=308745 RepID=A0A0F8VAE2_9EURO|nr:hypothetical protein ARAM_004058 [Aspergillus rambellii]